MTRVPLAICAIFRDEAPNLPEWLEFHRVVAGVARFLLFDNNSSDRPAEVLTPWTADGTVELRAWPTPFEAGAQRRAYLAGLDWARDTADRVAFIDVDEFLFSPRELPVPEIMARYRHAPGVVAHWQVYGSSGRHTRPGGLTVESFMQRAPAQFVRNRKVKSIVDPRRAIRADGPHFFVYEHGARAVDEIGAPVAVQPVGRVARWARRRLARMGSTRVDPFSLREAAALRSISISHLRINHYATRSREEFMEKLARHASSDPVHPSRSRLPDLYWRYHDRNEVEDPILAGHADALRRAIAATTMR